MAKNIADGPSWLAKLVRVVAARCLTFLANRPGIAGPLTPKQEERLEEMERDYEKFVGQKTDAKAVRAVEAKNASAEKVESLTETKRTLDGEHIAASRLNSMNKSRLAAF